MEVINTDAIDILKNIQNSMEETDFLSRCALDMAIEALQKPSRNVVYLCKYAKPDDTCKHTSNIRDAKNFIEVAPGKFMEKGGDPDV